MNVSSMDLSLTESGYFTTINGFVKFLGVVKTSDYNYKISYLCDVNDYNSTNFTIYLLRDCGYCNVMGDEIEEMEVIGQIIEPMPYGGYPTIEYIASVRQLTPEEYKLKNRKTVISNVLNHETNP